MKRRDESGFLTFQVLLSSPVVFMILFTIAQALASMYGNIVCRFAANAAVDAAAELDGTAESGRREAEERFSAFDSAVFVGDPVIEIRRTESVVEVRIRRTVYHVFPGLFDTSTATVVQPVQRFRPPGEA